MRYLRRGAARVTRPRAAVERRAVRLRRPPAAFAAASWSSCWRRSTGWSITALKPDSELYSAARQPALRRDADPRALRRPLHQDRLLHLDQQHDDRGDRRDGGRAPLRRAGRLRAGATALPRRRLIGLASSPPTWCRRTLLFIPMVQIMNRSACSTALGAGRRLPDLPDAVLHLADGRLLQDDPRRAGGVRAHRRGQPPRGDLADRHSRWPRPGILSAGIFAFTLSWNEFIYALTLVTASRASGRSRWACSRS